MRSFEEYLEESSKAEKEFEELVKAHDITYVYSSGRAYREGAQEYKRIQDFIKSGKISKEKATKIWNKYVDKKIREKSRKEYYWGK